MIIDLFSILPLTCAIFVLLFGFYMLFSNYRSPLHQLLFGFTMSMFLWQFGTFMMFANRENPQLALIWDRVVYAGVIFMPPFMHHFSLLFTGRTGQQKNLLRLNYFLAILSLIASRTTYFVDDIYVYSWGAHSQARILHHIFLGYFFVGTGLFFRNILTYYHTLKDLVHKAQTIYVFIAFAIVIFIGGSAYLYGYGIDTKFPFAYFSGLIFPIMLAYTVTRHHLLGTKVITTEILVGLADFVLVIQLFLARSLTEIVLRIIIVIGVSIIGLFLIKSVRKEVTRSEELTVLTSSLRQANIRLQELDRQKTEFLSIASHQLRTPLSIINGYIELIKEGDYGKVGKKMKEVLGNMDESNGRLVKLVDEFLNVTRIEQGRTKFIFEKGDLNSTVTSAVAELKERGEQRGLKLHWKPPAFPAMVAMDEEKIRNVVFNFIDNAIKYCDQGIIEVIVEDDKDGIILRVRDRGLGFDEHDQYNFFQKFYRGENVKGVNVTGTGLGLYVCRMFIEAHHGRVWATSPGLKKGSEFGFWLPATQPAVPPAPSPTPAEPVGAAALI